MTDPNKRDHINHPRHYTAGRVECIDYIEAQGFGYHEGNIVKYVTRYKFKNGLDDLKKAEWYLKRLIALLEAGENGLGGGQEEPVTDEEAIQYIPWIDSDLKGTTTDPKRCTPECLKSCPDACVVRPPKEDNGWEVDCSQPIYIDAQCDHPEESFSQEEKLEVARETLSGMIDSCPEGCANFIHKTHMNGAWSVH